MLTSLVIIFVVGYLFIAFEHLVKINKAAIALLTGVLCWTVYIVSADDTHLVNEDLSHQLGELSGILFFLMGAMTIVELIDAHDGFDIITNRITQTNKSKLLWIISILTFFLSAILDNLTTTIVIVSLLQKLIKDKEDRLYFAGMVVIASNAGGAWSPIGDVTTTMLWIGGQITASNIILKLFLPSLVSLLLPLVYASVKLKGNVERPLVDENRTHITLPAKQQSIVFFLGLLILILVPVFKTLTHLPPYMGILIGLAILWISTELLHGKKDEEDKHNFSVVYALRKIDTPSILFFLGILMAIASLQSCGLLASMATQLREHIHSDTIIVLLLGVLSAIVDNVPLVAAVQGMYGLDQYPTDHYFWEFLAYCTATGGSTLIIGSAAGVAAMGIEKIDFFWYIKRISFLALLGYFGGALVYFAQQYLI